MLKVFDLSYPINPAFLAPTPSLSAPVHQFVKALLPLLNAHKPTRSFLSFAFLYLHVKDLAGHCKELVFENTSWQYIAPQVKVSALAIYRIVMSLYFPTLYFLSCQIYELSVVFSAMCQAKSAKEMKLHVAEGILHLAYATSWPIESPRWQNILHQIHRGEGNTFVRENASSLMENQKAFEMIRTFTTLVLLGIRKKIQATRTTENPLPETQKEHYSPVQKMASAVEGCVMLVRIAQLIHYSIKQPLSSNLKEDTISSPFICIRNDLREEYALVAAEIIPMIAALVKFLLPVWGMDLVRSLNKSPNYHIGSKTPSLEMEQVIGCQEAKEAIKKVADRIKNPEPYVKLGVTETIKGILFFGPPGTGKSMLAKALATYIDNAKFIEQPASSFVQVYVGKGAQNVRSLFTYASHIARTEPKRFVVIFIDEINAVAQQRDLAPKGGGREINSTTEAFLTCIEELPSNVIVIGATNAKPQDLDQAFIRPGRFDQHIEFKLPSWKDRFSFFQYLTQKKYKLWDLTPSSEEGIKFWKEIARKTDGWSYAELDNLMKLAAMDAGYQHQECIPHASISKRVDTLKKTSSVQNSLESSQLYS